MPKFSIVIPLYNKEKHIKRALDSVLSQNVSDYELLIIDDGSTDKSAEIIKAYADPRIHLIHQENKGVSAARNKGIEEAKADHITFLDADDEWKPDFLQTISQMIEQFPEAGAYATYFIKIGIRGKEIKKSLMGIPNKHWSGILPNYLKILSLSENHPFHTSSICVRKDIFERIGYFSTKATRLEDIDMWLRISFDYPIAYNSKKCTIYHRDVENSICNSYLPKEICFEETIAKAFEDGKIDQNMKPHVKNLLSMIKCEYGRRYLLANKRAEARFLANAAGSKRLDILLTRIFIIFVSYLPYGIIRLIFKFSNIKPEFISKDSE